jgi:hypothetical protein
VFQENILKLMNEIITNPWFVGIGVTVIGGLVLYYGFDIGKNAPSKNYNLTSQHQSGGITAGEINIIAESNSNGGKGGDASAVGTNSTAIGGKGGGAGPYGKGGNGGDASVVGDNSFAMGGEGGEAGQYDRPAKGGRGPLQVLMEDFPAKWKEISKTFGLTEEDAKKYGRGGDGAYPVK